MRVTYLPCFIDTAAIGDAIEMKMTDIVQVLKPKQEAFGLCLAPAPGSARV
jgi:hypothetical protein